MSDLQVNPHAGVQHPLVKGARPWPVAGSGAGKPGGVWFPAKGTVRGTIVCLHGIQTHGGWFTEIAAPLTAAGWNVVAPDRRGSGVNTAAPFQKGHARKGEMLQDLSVQMTDAGDLARGKPVILLGTSWGSNLASAYCAKGIDPQPAALVQLVPATQIRYSGLAQLRTFLTRELPFEDVHYLPGRIQPADGKMGAPPKTGEPPGSSPAAKSGPIWNWLTTDRHGGTLLTRPSRATIKAGKALTNSWKKRGPLPHTLVIVATRDQIMNNAAAIAAAERAAEPGRPHIVRIEAGHGVQLSHPHKVAKEVLRWVNSWEPR